MRRGRGRVGQMPGRGGPATGPSVGQVRAAVAARSSAAASSQSSISWTRLSSLEKSAPTDSPRWMRRIASPISGATDSVWICGIRLRGGSGTVSVDDDLPDAGRRDVVDGLAGQDAVRGARVDLARHAPAAAPG